MSFEIDKTELARRIREEYQQLVELIDQLSSAQMEQPHAVGTLSIKDLLAHLIAHEQRAIQELRFAREGQRLPIDHAANDSFNAGAVAGSTPFDPASVRAAWDRSVQQVLATIHGLDDADFLPTSVLVQMLEDSIDGALGNNTYGHYAEHRPDIEAWINELGSASSIAKE